MRCCSNDDRTGHVLRRLVEVQRHHQLAGAVGFGGALAVVQVGRERREPRGGEAIDDVGDVRHQPPPLLDHDDAGTAAVAGQVAVARVAVGRKSQHLTHARKLVAAPRSIVFVRTQSTLCTDQVVSNTMGQ